MPHCNGNHLFEATVVCGVCFVNRGGDTGPRSKEFHSLVEFRMV